MEPFFSVLLSALFLGDVPSAAVLATLLPIVGGVALASMSEVGEGQDMQGVGASARGSGWVDHRPGLI